MRHRLMAMAAAAALAATALVRFAVAGSAAASQQPPRSELHVQVGPNVQVSLDGDFPHTEYVADAHPTDPNVIVVASIVLAHQHDVSNRTMMRTYATNDGGQTWQFSNFADSHEVDPTLAFAPNGDVFFTGIGMQMYRSRRGGLPNTWESLGKWMGGDHPMMTADHSNGPFRGRLYVHTAGGTYQTIDSGDRPVIHPRQRYPESGGMAMPPLSFDDGSVFLPFTGYERVAENRYDAITRFTWTYDGGETFTPMTQIRRHRYHGYETKRVRAGSFLHWAINPSFAGDRTRNRVYMVWDETESTLQQWLTDPARYKPNRVYMTYSDDRGKTWSEAREIDPGSPAHSAQFMGAVAVNRYGVVGVLWLDTRDDPKQLTYNAYFSASSDGMTFTAPRRLSSAPSFPMGEGNLWLNYHGQSYNRETGVREIRFDGGYRRWGPGGDYIWMAAAADGTFHPMWPDSRSGTFQIYTARVTAGGTPPQKVATEGMRIIDVADSVEIRSDGMRYDSSTAELLMPIRLHNRSSRTLHAPIRLTLTGNVDLTLLDVDGTAVNSGEVEISYDAMIGDAGTLRPGGVSDTRIWHFRHTGIQEVPKLRVRMTAAVWPDASIGGTH